jgi:NAD(P)H-flavin reductase
MLQQEADRPDGPPLVLLFGCRAEQDVLWREEIAGWTERCPRLRYEVTLSRPGSEWSGRTGYVQEHVPELWSELATDAEHPPHAFVCGLERMVGAVRSTLRQDLGARRRRVHTERYD